MEAYILTLMNMSKICLFCLPSQLFLLFFELFDPFCKMTCENDTEKLQQIKYKHIELLQRKALYKYLLLLI